MPNQLVTLSSAVSEKALCVVMFDLALESQTYQDFLPANWTVFLLDLTLQVWKHLWLDNEIYTGLSGTFDSTNKEKKTCFKTKHLLDQVKAWYEHSR